jgi:hypothetical protein
MVLVLSSSVVIGGIRAPGVYEGVVVFDQWDTCYLYDGIYLMYISEKIKERVRKYEGQTIRIDAKKVYQPMNPGDGLITEFNFLPLKPERGVIQHSGMAIKITPAFDIDCSPQFVIEIKNAGRRKIMIPKWAIAPTVFGEKADGFFSPSDGKSEACITRWSFPMATGESWNLTKYMPDGKTVIFQKSYGMKIDDGKVPYDYLTLSPGDSAHFRAALSVSPGSYDFLCGYTPTNDKRISNIVSFSVDKDGIATFICDRTVDRNQL